MDISKSPATATAYRRQKQIEECLYENLQLRPYSSVSISDLCHQLGISRKSFYNYFPDKETCLRAIINRRLLNCSLHLSADLPEDAPEEESIASYFRFWKNEKILLDIIVRNNLLGVLTDQCIAFLREENSNLLQFMDTSTLKSDVYVLSSFVSVHITILIQWYLENYETPLEEMVKIFQRLIYEPLIRRD